MTPVQEVSAMNKVTLIGIYGIYLSSVLTQSCIGRPSALTGSANGFGRC